jgi:hypothetical protein
MVQRIVTIKLSLIEESKNRTNAELIKELFEVFSNREFVIPWCDKIEELSINEI